MGLLSPPSVLIISDETHFAHTLIASWQAERHVPTLTLVTRELWTPHNSGEYDLLVVGPLRDSSILSLLRALPADVATIVCVRNDAGVATLRAERPRLLILPLHDGWTQSLILFAAEVLRRLEAARRAEHAERAASGDKGHAVLGHYMLDMRHAVADALTSILGNADLLLLEPGQLTSSARGQIKTIHSMALRLNEIMQRFSSLASEMRQAEKESQAETHAEHATIPPRG